MSMIIPDCVFARGRENGGEKIGSYLGGVGRFCLFFKAGEQGGAPDLSRTHTVRSAGNTVKHIC